MITLREDNLAEALVAPELGGWLLRYARQTIRHGLLNVLHFDQAVVARYPNQMYAGNPLLFPFASYNVLHGREHFYEWGGREYSLPQHGFARKLPWSVISQTDNSVTMELVSSAATLSNYPFSFRHEVSYRLSRGRLYFRQTIENRSSEPMPYTAGIHPYFKVPLLQGGQRNNCIVNLPSADRFEIQGKADSFVQYPQPAQPLSVGQDVSGTLFLGNLGLSEISLEDPAAGLRTVLNFAESPAHRFVALWASSIDAPYYCIEPWTALPNAFGRRDGLTLLGPGGKTDSGMWMDLQTI